MVKQIDIKMPELNRHFVKPMLTYKKKPHYPDSCILKIIICKIKFQIMMH